MAICVLSRKANSLQFISGQFVSDALEARAEGTVDDQVARAHDRPADETRIDLGVQAHLAFQSFLQRRGELFLFGRIERGGRGHGDIGDALGGVLQHLKLCGDLR